jgi:hypothetical protein
VDLGMGTGGKVMVNSPYTLATFISLTSYFALVVIAALAGQAVHQDFQYGTYALLFTTPLRTHQYLGGRLLGTLAVLLVIQASGGIGCFLGSLMPYVDQTLIGPNRAAAYLQPYLVVVLPNLVILTVLFFGLGALTRNMRVVYVTSVVLLLGYLIARTVRMKIEYQLYAALLDPFGMSAVGQLTKYWTVAEQNTRLLPLAGVLLTNRLIWVGAGHGRARGHVLALPSGRATGCGQESGGACGEPQRAVATAPRRAAPAAPSSAPPAQAHLAGMPRHGQERLLPG